MTENIVPSNEVLIKDPSDGQPEKYRNPYYVRKTQNWAVEQERQRHIQALYSVGEYCVFALMWHEPDFTQGLVDRCQTCFKSYGKIAETYGQSSQFKCPDCFGTTFEGGFRAIIVRPAIFTDADDSEAFQARGVVHTQELSVESTPDFRVLNGDYVFRTDNSRYRLRTPGRLTLRSGFTYPWQRQTNLTYNHSRAALEDPTSPAYDIPFSKDVLRGLLNIGPQQPANFSDFEIIRAPLIPADED